MVERCLSKAEVGGPNPLFRSKIVSYEVKRLINIYGKRLGGEEFKPPLLLP